MTQQIPDHGHRWRKATLDPVLHVLKNETSIAESVREDSRQTPPPVHRFGWGCSQ
jgi:hypothetical protein